MGEIFLNGKDDKFTLNDDKEWKYDQSYRKPFVSKYYAVIDKARIGTLNAKILYKFKINSKILLNGNVGILKFTNTDLIEKS